MEEEMNKIYTMSVKFMHKDKEREMSFPLIEDGKELILVDCGYPGFLPLIEIELKRLSFTVQDITKIIITHHDYDHIGSLKAFVDKNPSIEVLCSKGEIPYIIGKKKSLRLQQAEAIQASLPEKEKAGGMEFQRILAQVESIQQVRGICPGEILPYYRGIEVVDTSGHMPDHISLYIREEKTFITGDALVVVKGHLVIAYPESNLDIKATIQSVKRIQTYDIEKIICCHGGIYTKDIKGSLEKIIRTYDKK
jgi:glyoxylase-like metal-dependent hydrolase (beta-lactamase superfamily II)